jgi:predicted DNA-binding transcriptional regulator AlpA
MSEGQESPKGKTARQYLSIKEVAEMYGIGVSSIHRNIRLKKFPQPIKVGGLLRWHVDSLPSHKGSGDD